jgi:hypothetical protein
MSTSIQTKTAIANGLDSRLFTRILEEGYGPGAWHGPDMKAALEDVSDELAFWRPAPERHNIAEIALHYAYSARYVRGQISGMQPLPFVMEGDDWFSLSGDTLSWPVIRETLESEQRQLVSAVADVIAGRTTPSSTDERRFELVLGITSHAIYHAGQIQLLKKLAGSNR